LLRLELIDLFWASWAFMKSSRADSIHFHRSSIELRGVFSITSVHHPILCDRFGLNPPQLVTQHVLPLLEVQIRFGDFTQTHGLQPSPKRTSLQCHRSSIHFGT
jgi:hypothetical protein